MKTTVVGVPDASARPPGGYRRSVSNETGCPSTDITPVDTAARRLADLDHLPVHDHPTVFAEVHRQLASALDLAMTGPDED